jgi:hypothetical protein
MQDAKAGSIGRRLVPWPPSALICCHLALLHACSCAGDASSDVDDMASEEDDDEWTEDDDSAREQAAAEAEAAELEEKRRQAASRAGACW